MRKKYIRGSHLTVIVHPNGYRELKWDDAALARDVKEAITAYESGTLVIPEVKPKPKRTRKSKKPTHTFESLNELTKKQIDELAKKELGIDLDRRKKKTDLIEIFLQNC